MWHKVLRHSKGILSAVIRSNVEALCVQACQQGDGQLQQVGSMNSFIPAQREIVVSEGLPKITCLVSGQWRYDAELTGVRDGWEEATGKTGAIPGLNFQQRHSQGYKLARNSFCKCEKVSLEKVDLLN